MWEPQPLATVRASKACTGITLPYKVRNVVMHDKIKNLGKIGKSTYGPVITE
jgi:hypothetical protein